jgi:hypothetical protein
MISFKSVAYAGSVPIPVEMVYEGNDPYTMEFVFHHAGREVRWAFSKELLDALENDFTSGDGDVHFEHDDKAHILYMSLSSPEGYLIVEFDPCAVEEFMDEVNFSSEFLDATVEITDERIYAWLGGEAA